VTDPYFSIVVPTFRRPQALRDTLAALLALDYERNRYQVIVVDDGADESTAELVNRLQGQPVDIALASQHQRGAASARNRGARLAEGDLLLFVDDDIVVEPDHLRRHRVSRDRHGDALVSGAWEFAPHVLQALRATAFGRFRIELERQFQNEAIGSPVSDGCVEQALLGSWNLALRRELFWDLGGFDEQFPVAGAEDQDFSLRARAAGCLLLLDLGIRCLHIDDRLDLRSYCRREERSAQTMPFLARKYPAQFGHAPYVVENRPISPGDPARLVIKKLLKAGLASGPILELLHRLTGVLERARMPEWVLRRIYRPLLGLHLFRGFRRTSA
jgi:GT2 family glycosyltransferase